MPAKLTFADVKKTFVDARCVLLATSYLNSHVKLTYICECGTQHATSLDNFKKGKRCRKCASRKKSESRVKHTLEEAKKLFRSGGCTLLADRYINCTTSMPYICECGGTSHITLTRFNMGQRCRVCKGRKNAEKQRLSYAYVRQFFEDRGCKLLATEYVNSSTYMPYICECGDHSENCYNHFKEGVRCKACTTERTVSALRNTIGFVKEYFRLQGCVLLANEYKNARTHMPYICSCGNESSITYDNFANKGHRCKKCKWTRMWKTRRTNPRPWKDAELNTDIEQLLKERINFET